MRKLLMLIIICTVNYYSVQAQGCVAIRNNGGVCTMSGPHQEQDGNNKGWTFALNSRYFKSFRHFVGTDEQKQRVEQGTEVVNHVFSTELALTKMVNDRWSFGIFLPVISNDRSSLYEHDGKTRHSTHSFGTGDLRVAGYYWLIDPAKRTRLNVQLGLGIKFPTGDYRYQDYFYKNDSVKVLGPVDQSIQLGDGGTGITGELNAFYHVSRNISVYANAYYLANPREQNGVSTARGGITSPSSVTYGSDVMSVPDQYMLRAGGSLVLDKFVVSAGMRMECLPVYDLLGGSGGFRRPGYVISAEPVVAYKINRTQLYFSVPVAVERNRTQSVPDKIKTQKTGVYSHGDAAFADYSINLGVAFSFN
ncbi:MAG: hypothetical protein ACJ75B_04865 [Flavisolibacter sp.]